MVNAGEIIGYSGKSGTSVIPHLHFGVYEDGRMVNPQLYLLEKVR